MGGDDNNRDQSIATTKTTTVTTLGALSDSDDYTLFDYEQTKNPNSFSDDEVEEVAGALSVLLECCLIS